jgi:hypothetical protein
VAPPLPLRWPSKVSRCGRTFVVINIALITGHQCFTTS